VQIEYKLGKMIDASTNSRELTYPTNNSGETGHKTKKARQQPKYQNATTYFVKSSRITKFDTGYTENTEINKYAGIVD